jgi:hypothetical protein
MRYGMIAGACLRHRRDAQLSASTTKQDAFSSEPLAAVMDVPIVMQVPCPCIYNGIRDELE